MDHIDKRILKALQHNGKLQNNELEKQIKEIDDEVIRPLELKVANLLKLCSDKASEFHVISDYVAKCNAKAQGEQNTPVGVLPDASYWTTRWVSDEVASR